MSSRRYDRQHLRVSCSRDVPTFILTSNQVLPRRSRFRFRVFNPIVHWLRGGFTAQTMILVDAQFALQPTSMRAIRARYDPYEQAKGRVDQLRGLGHSVDKVEIM